MCIHPTLVISRLTSAISTFQHIVLYSARCICEQLPAGFLHQGLWAAGTEFSPLAAAWAAQQCMDTLGGWPAPSFPPGGIQRPQSADPARPRSADPIRRGLEGPVDAGMAALGFMSDDVNGVTVPSPGTCVCWSDLVALKTADHLDMYGPGQLLQFYC